MAGCIRVFVTFLISALLFSFGCASGPPKTWLFLIYMDGDNDLSPYALGNIEQLRAASYSKYITIAVQLDLPGGITTKRYVISNGVVEMKADLGELNMADPQTLTDFLVWGKTTFSADKTVVVLWDHGNGWDQMDGVSKPLGAAKQARPRSIFYDTDNNAKFLANYRVRQAVENAAINIDVLGLDASIMGTIEALYEFRNLSPIIIASQEVGQAEGWDYTAIMGALGNQPGMNEASLAKAVVDSYRNKLENVFYPANPLYEKRHSITAFRTFYFDSLATEVDLLASRLSQKLDTPSPAATISSITAARNAAQPVDLYVQPYVYIDLADFALKIGGAPNIGTIIGKSVIADYHGSARPNMHGVSIVFFKLPESLNLTFDANYHNYDASTNTGNRGAFINGFGWDEFINKYYAKAP